MLQRIDAELRRLQSELKTLLGSGYACDEARSYVPNSLIYKTDAIKAAIEAGRDCSIDCDAYDMSRDKWTYVRNVKMMIEAMLKGHYKYVRARTDKPAVPEREIWFYVSETDKCEQRSFVVKLYSDAIDFTFEKK